MATIICPDANWVYKYNDMEESSSNLDVDDSEFISFSNTGNINIQINGMNTDDTLLLYDVFDDGVSISDDNKITLSTKSTLPPTTFKYFQVFMEDFNGETATYTLDNKMVGKEETILLSAFVKSSEDFNPSYVVKFGFKFINPDKQRTFKFTLYDMHTVYRVEPQYAQPQEVINFLGMVDNKGQRFKLTDASVPSYNDVAQRICEAEDFIEGQCKQSWVERRVENEYRNVDSVEAFSLGYMGIYAMGADSGMQMFFTGYPVKLIHNDMRSIDYSKGDKVEIRRYGNEWMVVPEENLWADEAKGIIYIRELFFQKDTAVRISYRYGHGPIPNDIKRAVLLYSAMIIVGTDWYRQRFPNSGGADPLKQETLQSWTWQLKDILKGHASYIGIGAL